jgi:hypothetical protein
MKGNGLSLAVDFDDITDYVGWQPNFLLTCCFACWIEPRRG